MRITILILWISASITLTVAVYPITRNQIVYDDVERPNQKTSDELASIFNSSIIYWDIDKSENISDSEKSEMKQNIMNDLVHMSLDSQQCYCPRTIDTTFICDSTGKLHSSICKFHCRFADIAKEDITPKMILTETEFPQSKKMCQQWYNRHRKAEEEALSAGVQETRPQ